MKELLSVNAPANACSLVANLRLLRFFKSVLYLQRLTMNSSFPTLLMANATPLVYEIRFPQWLIHCCAVMHTIRRRDALGRPRSLLVLCHYRCMADQPLLDRPFAWLPLTMSLKTLLTRPACQLGFLLDIPF